MVSTPRYFRKAVDVDGSVDVAGDVDAVGERGTAETRPQIVDGLISGLHAPSESHFDLLRAFASRASLAAALDLAKRARLSAHELGDVMLIV